MSALTLPPSMEAADEQLAIHLAKERRTNPRRLVASKYATRTPPQSQELLFLSHKANHAEQACYMPQATESNKKFLNGKKFFARSRGGKTVARKVATPTPVIQMKVLDFTHHVFQKPDGTCSSTPAIETCSHVGEKHKAEERNAPTPIFPIALKKAPAKSLIVKLRIVVKPIQLTSSSATFGDHVRQNEDGRWTSSPTSNVHPRIVGVRKRKSDELADDTAFDPASVPELATTAITDSSSGAASPKRRATAAKKFGSKSSVKSSGYVKYYLNVQEDKPEPIGRPPVWSDKRQSLCETLWYYRAYQSGAYLSNGIVRGFMVDKEVGIRDKLDEEILIARVGGGRTKDEATGEMKQTTDQEKSAIALGFQRSLNEGIPVAVIVGQGNRISPSKLPHYYNIFDWFLVTDVWCEKTNGLKCWMVRLEKVRLTEKSWWAPINSPPIDPNRDFDAIKTTSRVCTSCRVPSKHIYNAGWTCLHTKCKEFFNFERAFLDIDLDFVPEFLKERSYSPQSQLLPLAPPPITNNEIEQRGGFGIEKECKGGIVCPECHGCIRRIAWDHWKCETHGCSFTYQVTQKSIKVSQAISDSYTTATEICDETFGIRTSQRVIGHYNVYEYILPGENGEAVGLIRHFKANGIINSQPDGPNDLFMQMQERDFGLRRHPSRQKGSTGEILTSHWAANWGAPYKYGVTVLSRAFQDAPDVIVKALKRLTWAGECVVTENLEAFHPFNELLSLGYFEDTSIGYHDDGESTLGPTIATLSLGASAVMAIRPKAKANLGPASKNSRGTKRDVLKFVLSHGDLVVMHGRGVQSYYEHAVTPMGKLRFALTCRYICPEALASDAQRIEAATKSALPTGHEAWTYHGDVGVEYTPVTNDSEATDEMQMMFNNLMGRALAGTLGQAETERLHRGLTELQRHLPSVRQLQSARDD